MDENARRIKELADQRVELYARREELDSQILLASREEESSLGDQRDEVILAMAENADQLRTLVDSNLGDSVEWNYFDQRLKRPGR